MGLFEHFPYVNFHELNVDWILRKLKSLEQRMDAAEARLDAAEARLDVIEADIIDIRAEIVQIKNRLTSLENRCTALEGRCSDLEDRCTALEGRCSDLEDRCTALEGRCTALEARMETKLYEVGQITFDDFIQLINDYMDGVIFPIFYERMGAAPNKSRHFFYIQKINYRPSLPDTTWVHMFDGSRTNTSETGVDPWTVGYLVTVDEDTPGVYTLDWTPLEVQP